MKKKIFTFITLLVLSLNIRAQVDNYALHFTDDEGIVNLGIINDFTSTDYTLQFWFCPSKWEQGAALVRSGKYSIRLGNEHALVFNDGTNHITLTNIAIGTGKWCHVTLRKKGTERTQVSLNNQVVSDVDYALSLPAGDKSLWLGGNYQGRIDEVRLWNTWLPTAHESFYRNTLNKLHPQYSSLCAYWKIDQEQCPNVYDYTGHGYNGTLSATGVTKEKVTDNTQMKYRISLGYGNVERFFDRQIDADHYGTLANKVSILGIWTYADGTAKLYSQNDAGTLMDGAEWLGKSGSHTGVLNLTTAEARMEAPASALPSDATAWTWEAWVMVKEWDEGAYIMRKEENDSTGLSIRLGALNASGTGNFIARLNGKDVTIGGTRNLNMWYHVVLTNTDFGATTAIGAGSAKMVIGEGLKGKFDNVLIWTSTRTSAQTAADAIKIPMPGPSTQMGAWDWYQMAACYSFDKQSDPGFDSYSVQGYVDEMRQLAGNMRGVKYIVTAVQPSNNALDETMADATKRETMGKMLADIANDPYFDGLDIDFEWTYSEAGWTNIAQMLHIVRQNLKSGKTLSVSPHNVTYNYPTSYMSDIDYFNFQQYGPQSTHSEYSTFVNYAQKFVNWGYPRDKIVLSYATTTAKGSNGSAIQGYRWFANSDDITPSTSIYTNASGESFQFNSLDQVEDRSRYVVDNDLGGIMYWDMGNDLPSTNEMSMARTSAYVIASNVDSLVTIVSTYACSPNDDPSAPEETAQPEDQGGSSAQSTKLLTLDDIESGMAVNIINKNGLGILYNNSSSSNLWLGESSNATYSQKIDHDGKDALWLIMQREGTYYLYNIGRGEFVNAASFNVTSQPCTFQGDPVELEMTGTSGIFTFRLKNSTVAKDYMCASPQLSGKPVCQWTSDDNGSQWEIMTVPLYDASKDSAQAQALIDYYYDKESYDTAHLISSLDEVNNTTAYNIKNNKGLGLLISNDTQSNVWLAESNNSNFSASTNHFADRALWLLINYNGAYYLYNVGKKQFVNVPTFNVTSIACTLQNEPFALEVNCTDGIFTMRKKGSTAEKGYLCASPQNTSKPVCQWTNTDDGSLWQLIEIPSYDAENASAEAIAKIDEATNINMVTMMQTSDVIYDLQGRRLNCIKAHGIYIVNGKKIIK